MALPETHEDFPWGDCVVKVRKKVFVLLGDETTTRVSLKLQGGAHEHALSIDGATPTAYNLGKAGWVSIPLGGVAYELLAEWLVGSYCLVAPKKLAQTLATAHKR